MAKAHRRCCSSRSRARTLLLSFILGLGSLFAMIYGAAVGAPNGRGARSRPRSRGESRSRYQLLSFASMALMVGIGLLVAFAIGVAVAGRRRESRAGPDDRGDGLRHPSARCLSSWVGAGWRSPRRARSASPSRRSRAASSPGSASGSRSISRKGSRRSSCRTSCNTCRSVPPTRSWQHRTAAPSGRRRGHSGRPRTRCRAAGRHGVADRGARRRRGLHRTGWRSPASGRGGDDRAATGSPVCRSGGAGEARGSNGPGHGRLVALRNGLDRTARPTSSPAAHSAGREEATQGLCAELGIGAHVVAVLVWRPNNGPTIRTLVTSKSSVRSGSAVASKPVRIQPWLPFETVRATGSPVRRRFAAADRRPAVNERLATSR